MNSKISFVETPKEIAKLMVKLSTISKKGLVLDTGCGNGIFLEALREEGYKNILGIEIDEELYKTCTSKGFNVILADFLKYQFKGKFDLIIGNPPYAHFNQLPEQVADNVRKIIGTSEGDIYYAFIIKSINLLKEGGELIYIVPYHFFYNTYAKVVREHILRNGKIEIIIDLDEIRLFKGENPETIIFKFKKGFFNLRREIIKILNIKSKKITPPEIMITTIETLNSKGSNKIWDYKEINHFTTTTIWSSYLPSSISQALQFPSVKLKEIAKVGVGPVSGFDKAFLISEEEFLKLNEKEKTLVKKFVKAKNCIRFITQGYYYYILIEDKIDEDELKSEYPNIYSKLSKFKNALSKRYLPEGKKWFHWQALRNYNFLISNLEKKRIYVPALDRKPYNRFSLGEENLLPSSDVIFIQPYKEDDIWFLLGFLNSQFFRDYYLSNGGRRGGRIAFTQRILDEIKIIWFSDSVREKIKNLTQDIISKLKKNESIKQLEDKIENIIYESIKHEEYDNLLLFNI
jgi:adenine-specific DNA-methyltransferase